MICFLISVQIIHHQIIFHIFHLSTEKSLKEHGDKVSAEEKKSIENGITDLKQSLEGTDIEDIKKKTETLVQASMKLGEAIYKSQKNTKSDSNKDDGKDEKGKKDDNVVDADFEEVKDENKEKTKALAESSMKLGEAIYKSQQQEQQTEQTKPESKKDDNVVDADFEEVKDKKEE